MEHAIVIFSEKLFSAMAATGYFGRCTAKWAKFKKNSSDNETEIREVIPD